MLLRKLPALLLILIMTANQGVSKLLAEDDRKQDINGSILKRLDSIDNRLNSLEKRTSIFELREGVWRIFPENLVSTKSMDPESAKKHTNEILLSLKGREDISRRWDVVYELLKIGTRNVDILIREYEREVIGQNNYEIKDLLMQSITILANESNKTIIIDRLSGCHDLIKIINEKNWISEAAITIISEFSQESSESWFFAVVKLRSIGTYGKLLEYAENHVFPLDKYYAIEMIFDFPKDMILDSVSRLWNRYKNKERSRSKIEAAAVASEMGIIESFRWLLDSIMIQAEDDLQVEIVTIVKSLSNFKGGPTDISMQYCNDKNKLVFDEKERRYKLRVP